MPDGRGGARTSREGRSGQRPRRELRQRSLEERAPAEPEHRVRPGHEPSAAVQPSRASSAVLPSCASVGHGCEGVTRLWLAGPLWSKASKALEGGGRTEEGQFPPSRSSAPSNWHRAAAWLPKREQLPSDRSSFVKASAENQGLRRRRQSLFSLYLGFLFSLLGVLVQSQVPGPAHSKKADWHLSLGGRDPVTSRLGDRRRTHGGSPSPPGPTARAARTPPPACSAPSLSHTSPGAEPSASRRPSPGKPALLPWGSCFRPHALWCWARHPRSESPSFLGVLLFIHRVL